MSVFSSGPHQHPLDTARQSAVLTVKLVQEIRDVGVIRTMTGAFRRLTRALKRYRVRGTAFRLYVAAADQWFDLRHGTDTCGCVPLDELSIIGGNQRRGFRYEPGRIAILRRLFRHIRPMLPANCAVVDLGGGKGRVLLIASEFGFAQATSVEFAHELCQVAETNCARYKKQTATNTVFRIVESDVVEYKIDPREHAFLMFNPFDEVILARVLDNIRSSVKAHPRKILICYYTPLFEHAILAGHDFEKVDDLDFWGYHLTIYSNSSQQPDGRGPANK
jgi:16S rRNA G966 N2-methylase RsmD